MIRKIDHRKMGTSDLGWLKSIFHFSFADYYNPDNMNFGVLRVINDDLIAADTGFDTHPHRDMEIVSYVIDGELTHADNMGNRHQLTRGQVQYMSAGTGVLHSEHNLGDITARLLQIWIMPDQRGYVPQYGDYAFQWEDRKQKWLHLVSGDKGSAPIKIHQDVNIYVIELEENSEVALEINEKRQAYVVQIEGASQMNSEAMEARDAMEVIEENLQIKAISTAHIMVIEMNKE